MQWSPSRIPVIGTDSPCLVSPAQVTSFDLAEVHSMLSNPFWLTEFTKEQIGGYFFESAKEVDKELETGETKSA